jgi:hypothetical protein
MDHAAEGFTIVGMRPYISLQGHRILLSVFMREAD